MENEYDVDDQLPDENEADELYEHHRFNIDKGQEPLRIDKWLINRIQNASRNRIQIAADAGNILVNGKPVKSSYKVKPLDTIVIVLPYPPRDKTIQPENLNLNIVYEDSDLLMVNKRPGMVVHPGHGNYEGTLVHGLTWHFQQLPAMKNAEYRPGLVHRIDKNTSGLLVIAKSEYAMTHLAKQFFDHSIDRTYYALVWGDVAADEGTITGNIARDLKNRKMFRVYEQADVGKHAITHYKVLERLGYVTLMAFTLETGRTHQIRVHSKYIGHPIFNDNEYGGDKIVKGSLFNKYKQFIENCFEVMPRLALHAKSLGFTHPTTGERMFFDTELPHDISQVLEKWKGYIKAKPWVEDE